MKRMVLGLLYMGLFQAGSLLFPLNNLLTDDFNVSQTHF